jgi:hypothetical protein
MKRVRRWFWSCEANNGNVFFAVERCAAQARRGFSTWKAAKLAGERHAARCKFRSGQRKEIYVFSRVLTVIKLKPKRKVK